MKKALISPNENYSVVQVEDAEFPVANPLMWADCQDSVRVGWGYDPENKSFIEKPHPATAIPQFVTRAQARKALAIQGFFNLVQPAIDSIADPLQQQLAQIDWDDSLTYERNNATLAMLATALGLTSKQLDDLFILAATQP